MNFFMQSPLRTKCRDPHSGESIESERDGWRACDSNCEEEVPLYRKFHSDYESTNTFRILKQGLSCETHFLTS